MDIARVEMTDSQQSCWQSILRIAMHTKNAVLPSDARNSGPLFIASEALKPRHRRLWELQLREVTHLTDDGVLTIFVWMDAKECGWYLLMYMSSQMSFLQEDHIMKIEYWK